MKTSQTILSAVLFAGLLSASAFATTPAAHSRSAAAVKFDAPTPASVVSPVGLPPSFEGKTVKLTMTIDAAGQAHNIRVVSSDNLTLTKSLVAAVSRWSFTPARKNGVPVSSKVELPLVLAAS